MNDEEKIISLYESDKKIIHNLPYYQGQSHVHWWGAITSQILKISSKYIYIYNYFKVFKI